MDMNISNNIMIHNKTLTQTLNMSNEYDFFPNKKTDLLEIYWKMSIFTFYFLFIKRL
jgi:hypothetical protein